MTIKYFSLLFFLFFVSPFFASFSPDILVKTEQAYVPINQAGVQDTVACVKADGNYTFNKVTHTRTRRVKKYITIVLDADNIVTTCDQKIYLPREELFKEAEQLKVGDILLSYTGKYIPVCDSIVTEQEKDFCDISVHECHNFFVSRSEILVHNFAPVFVGLSWAFGAGAAEFLGASLGTLLCGSAIGMKIHRDRACGNNFTLCSVHEEINDSYYRNDAQAPGMPTANDGYEPPKNWDSKKVRHSKTGQYGYPDKKGSVWVPTGPGPLAHGGAHWDVIYPNGKDYDNVYPGGKARKGKK